MAPWLRPLPLLRKIKFWGSLFPFVSCPWRRQLSSWPEKQCLTCDTGGVVPEEATGITIEKSPPSFPRAGLFYFSCDSEL